MVRVSELTDEGEQGHRPEAETPNLNVQRHRCILTVARMSGIKDYPMQMLSNYLFIHL